MNLTNSQKEAISQFREKVHYQAACLSEKTGMHTSFEIASLLAMEYFEEYSRIDEGVYFDNSSKDSGVDPFTKGFREFLSDHGYTTFNVADVGYLILDADKVSGFINIYATNSNRNLSLQGYCNTSNKLYTLVVDYIREYRRNSNIKAILLVKQSSYSRGVEAGETTINVDSEYTVSPSFYPFLEYTPKGLWEEFSKSRSNVLVIIGSPGTGKTSFIREMLSAQGWQDVHVCDDHNALTNEFLVDLFREIPDGGVFVAEDADNLVKKREDGNTQMSALLNASEGIAKTKNKFIISTNLPTIRDIDPALIRPGRTFSVLEFRELTLEEANVIREEVGKEPFVDMPTTAVTLSQALNVDDYTSTVQKHVVGFC